MVCVIAKDGKPLMPTKRHGKVKWLLRKKKAKIEKASPFTIRLLYEPKTQHVQPVTLGVDAGSKHVGFSASTEREELFSGEMMLRDDVPKKMAGRRQARRTRRSRLRYREPRFDNRTRKNSWLTPTMETKIRSHENAIRDIASILPVSKVIIETAAFDIQKIKNASIQGKAYQQGAQLGYENVKLYVKSRDDYTCQTCGSHKNLQVHHIIQRKDGGSDRPDNLITLCENCHQKHHNGNPLDILEPKDKGFRAATEMSTMRWFLLERVKDIVPDTVQTYGYTTNWTRNHIGIEKTHANDAYCIAGNLAAVRAENTYNIIRIRSHNRQMMKENITKGGNLKRNQGPHIVKGIARYDVVRYEDGHMMIITARKTRGLYSLMPLAGSKTLTDVPRRKFTLLYHSNGEIITRRLAVPTSGQA